MILRIGRVTNVYPATGKVKVMYEDENNASVPLPMLTMNREYSMPAVGEMVVTAHMENGSSKGFVLGTYYGGNTQPAASSGYRKDFGGGAYVTCEDGVYTLHAGDIILQADNIGLKGSFGETTVSKILDRLSHIEASIGEDSADPSEPSEPSGDESGVCTYPIVDGSDKLEPEKYYTFGEVDSLAIELVEIDDGNVHEYCFEFTASDSFTDLTITPTPVWAGVSEPTPGKTHQVSIVRGIGVMIIA